MVDHTGAADTGVETGQDKPPAEQPPPPDRPGTEGAPSRADSRNAAAGKQVADQRPDDQRAGESGVSPATEEPVEERGAESGTDDSADPRDQAESSGGRGDELGQTADDEHAERSGALGVEGDGTEQTPIVAEGSPDGSPESPAVIEADSAAAEPADSGQGEGVGLDDQLNGADAEIPAQEEVPEQPPAAKDDTATDLPPSEPESEEATEPENFEETQERADARDQKTADEPRDPAGQEFDEHPDDQEPARKESDTEKAREKVSDEPLREDDGSAAREPQASGTGVEAGQGSSSPGAGELFGLPGAAEATAGPEEGDRPGAVVDRPMYPEVTDRSEYIVTEREFDFAGVSADQAWDMYEQRVPLGARPEQWDSCVAELREALAAEGIIDADVRLQGSGARFCSENPKKWFPQNEDELRAKVSEHYKNAPQDERTRRAENAVAVYREAGFSEDRPKPAAPFFDSMYKLDTTNERSDYDVQIASDDLAERFQQREEADPGTEWRSVQGGHFKHRHLKDVAPAVYAWARRWENTFGREVTLSTFDRQGPSTGLRDGDWTMIEPEETT